MRREELTDLNAFLTVADEHSFTRAAAVRGHKDWNIWEAGLGGTCRDLVGRHTAEIRQ